MNPGWKDLWEEIADLCAFFTYRETPNLERYWRSLDEFFYFSGSY